MLFRSPAPALGEHNRELLAAVGVDDARYEGLLAAGAVCEGARDPIDKGDDE